MKMTKFICSAIASFAVLYGASSQAAFTGDATVLVLGSVTTSGGFNTGVDFDGTDFPLAFGLNGPSSTLASAGGGLVDFGFSSPFSDIDFSPLISDPASTALDGQIMMSASDFLGNTVALTFDSLVAIQPNSGTLNGSVDFAGLGTLTYNGGEATEVFWTYAVDGLGVGVNIDTAGASSSLNTFNSSNVPVPAALWLFASALAVAGGVKRVKQ